MNFDDYDKRYETVYTEFAKTVRFILESAIGETDGVPRPQSIQARAKTTASLKSKLVSHGLLDSGSIERGIKDLAGVRLIFYTNTDVDQFLNSRLIPDNFEVDWKETKIHHPTIENEQQRYQAIHYTVCLSPERSVLPEYLKFKSMRCEIQIQTILNHAWAETSHDILYKAPESKGFGGKAFQALEKRMMRIMDDHFLPAGYELQKVQHDFQRLMQGKVLFDRGTLDALEKCSDNNERYETLSTIREYVLPNYDDIKGIHPELRAALVSAVDIARNAEIKPIETAFGNLDGKSAQDVTAVVVDILDDLRYVDIDKTFQSLVDLYRDEQSKDSRKRILQAVEHLARYDLRVWQQAGSYVQFVLASSLALLTPQDRATLRPIVLTACGELLNSELRGATFSADSMTISTGAVQATDDLRTIREKAVNSLFLLYEESYSASEKLEIFAALQKATHLPSQVNYSNELCSLVLNNTRQIVEFLADRPVGEPYELFQHVEHSLLFQYQRAQEIAGDEQDKFGCKELADGLIQSILKFRDILNLDSKYVRYKTLVGYDSVFEASWEDEEFDYNHIEGYRTRQVAEYIQAISEETEGEWYGVIERCAATKSNDGATFLTFGEFLYRLAKEKPQTAIRFLKRANDDLLGFLPAFLNGLAESCAREKYGEVIEAYLAAGQHLTAIVRHFRKTTEVSSELIEQALSKAVFARDNVAVIECLVLAFERTEAAKPSMIEGIFRPALKYLTGQKDVRWMHGVWFLRGGDSFFRTLSAGDTDLVLESLSPVLNIDYQVERILVYIAQAHPEAVWKFLVSRLSREHEAIQRYEAVPYEFHGLERVLATNVDLAVGVIRSAFQPRDGLFRFAGGRLLAAVFRDFPNPFSQKLCGMVESGADDDLEFIFGILQNYKGQSAIHAVLKEIIQLLPEDDVRLAEVEICISNTGVVMGEFGFADAFRTKKTEMELWLNDSRPRVKKFAEEYIRKLDGRIASEQRSAEQRRELRKRDFDVDGED